MHDLRASFDASFRRETFASLAGDFESTVDLRGCVRLPYALLVDVAVLLQKIGWARELRGITPCGGCSTIELRRRASALPQTGDWTRTNNQR